MLCPASEVILEKAIFSRKQQAEGSKQKAAGRKQRAQPKADPPLAEGGKRQRAENRVWGIGCTRFAQSAMRLALREKS